MRRNSVLEELRVSTTTTTTTTTTYTNIATTTAIAITATTTTCYMVPTPPGKSWIFFLENPGPGKSSKPGKSWKLMLKVLEWFKWKTSNNSIAPTACI